MKTIQEPQQDFNLPYWGYRYLIDKCSDNYLNTKGRVASVLVVMNGECQTISSIAKKLKMNPPYIHQVCTSMAKDGHIELIQNGNKTNVRFSEEVLREGSKIAICISKG